MAPPANDNFASAIALSTTLPGSLSGLTTRDATFEAGEPGFYNATEQSIWFTFTPTTTGWYRFRIPFSSISYDGVDTPSWGEVDIILDAASSLAAWTTLRSGGVWNGDSAYTDPNAIEIHNPSVAALLTSGTTYYIRISSPRFGVTNRATTDFDFEWEALDATSSNDNFASAQSLTGATGSHSVNNENATTEGSEPAPYYWWDAGLVGEATVWFDWLCPASGWYEFTLEADDWANTSWALGVFTGSVLGSLTAISRMDGGSPPNAVNPTGSTTVVRFLAVSGTHYKIQAFLPADSMHAYGGAATLSWTSTSAPIGDTTSTAVGPVNGVRTNNYGNSDDELPPNAVSRLSSHPDWYYSVGAVGRSKWIRFDAVGPGTFRVEAREYTDARGYGEYALLVYKGADYASLVAATNNNGDDAVLIGFGPDAATTIGTGALVQEDSLAIDFVDGEIIWVCMVGLYDGDTTASPGVTPADAPQLAIDLTATPDPPGNDEANGFSLLDATYLIGRSEFGGYFNQCEADQREGSTVTATSQAGEPAHAGFGPTRSVWYYLVIPKSGDYKIWVESATDCVLAVYDDDGTSGSFAGTGGPGTLIASDDDSGVGNQPEITHTFASPGNFWVVVDSRTEGAFTLKFQRQSSGTPPANDDFASAEVISSIPAQVSGTTFDATGEPEEREAERLGSGVKDTVWYKYVAAFTGTLKIKATCDTFDSDAYVYVDSWHGTSLDTLIRHPEPPPTGPGGGINRGFFNHFDSPTEIDQAAITLDIVNGETYYIRVQTESGGSEDFTLYVETAAVYLDLQASGAESGPFNDAATVYFDLRASGTEIHHIQNSTDAATVPLTLTPGVTWETLGHETTDAATVYLTLSVLGGECYSRFHFVGEGEADTRWAVDSVLTRWASDPATRWAAEVEIQPGC